MNDSTPSRFRLPLGAFGVGLGLIVGFWLLRKALAPFFLAMVLAYILVPAVTCLSRWMKREWAGAALVIGSVGIVALILWLAVPRLVEQVSHLINTIPVWKAALEARWDPWLAAHPWMRDKIMQIVGEFDSSALVKGVWGAGAGLLSGFLEAMTFLLVPVMVYYLLVEGDFMLQFLDELVPPRYRPRVRNIVETIHVRLGGYIRGQISVMLVMALLQGLAFQIVGVPYAWLLGLIAGISNVVPYSPYLTAMAPAMLVAALGGAAWLHVLMIALVFTGVQKLEAFYFTPVWIGRASKLHPLEVLIAILCFGFALGVVGLIFAVPLMIILKVVLATLIDDYKTHPWFLNSDSPESQA